LVVELDELLELPELLPELLELPELPEELLSGLLPELLELPELLPELLELPELPEELLSGLLPWLLSRIAFSTSFTFGDFANCMPISTGTGLSPALRTSPLNTGVLDGSSSVMSPSLPSSDFPAFPAGLVDLTFPIGLPSFSTVSPGKKPSTFSTGKWRVPSGSSFFRTVRPGIAGSTGDLPSGSPGITKGAISAGTGVGFGLTIASMIA
jgi:hypothetical protein